MNSKEIDLAVNTISIDTIETNSRFDFHNCNNSMIVSNGSLINVEGEKSGTLGAFIKFNNDSEIYLLTNHHVIIKNKSPLGSKVYSKNVEIAQTYWGTFNDEFDAAVAKLNKPISNAKKFGKLNKTKIGDLVNKYNLHMGSGEGKIYSSNAIIKIRNRIFKNQILIEGLSMQAGESGTVIALQNKDSKPDPIGLHMGGDQNLSIANNLYNLFYSEIKPNTDEEDRLHPSLFFNSFY